MPLYETILLYVLSIWSIIWKGLALWRAAKQAQRNWFIVLLVINTAGILDIVYLFRFSKKRMTMNEITTWFKTAFQSSGKSK